MPQFIEEEPVLFSVSQIAKMYGISGQAVRYYHREKLLIPETREENSYRKYGYNQIYTLAMICYLRKIGLSIDDIRDYMRSSDTQKNLSALKGYTERLLAQCAEIHRIVDSLQEKTAFIERELQHLSFDTVRLERLPERYYVELGSEVTAGRNDIFFRYPTIACYQPSERPNHYVKKFGAYLTSGDPDALRGEYTVRRIPPQRFLTAYYQGHYSTVYQKIDQLRQQHRQYRFASVTYCINIVDQFIENDQEHYVVCIQIPVEDP